MKKVDGMRSVAPVESVAYMYEYMRWNDKPEFVELKERHREYMTGERDKLFKIACGPDGFESWQPSAEDCGRKASTGPI